MSKILEGNIQKKAHSEVEYNSQLEEELKMCMPEFNKDAHHYFMTNFGYIKHPSKGKQLYVPYEYQMELIENFHNYRFNINMLGRQMGKALWEETPILTSNGWSTMGELEVGDYVYDEYRNKTKVVYKTERQLNRECYNVVFKNGETIKCDAEHEWLINGKVVQTRDINTIENPIIKNMSPTNLYYLDFAIKRVVPTNSVPVYCITVDNPSQLFLIGMTQIPTHNCTTGDTVVSIRNKTTGEIMNMNLNNFHEMIRKAT